MAALSFPPPPPSSSSSSLHRSPFRVTNSVSGNSLSGLLWTLSSSSSPSSSPLRYAILCHGLKGDKEFHYFPHLSYAMLNDPSPIVDAVISFDFHGFGESEGVYKKGSYRSLVTDIETIIGYIEKELKGSIIVLIGRSMGGNAVWLFAALHPGRIPFIIGCCARYRFDDGGEFLLTKESVMFPSLLHGSHPEYLILHGTSDKRIPVEDADQFYWMFTQKFSLDPKHVSLVKINGADHNFSDRSMYEPLIDQIIGWLKEKGIDHWSNDRKEKEKHSTAKL